jgi:hypothetical protein
MDQHTPGPWVVKPPGSVVGHEASCAVKEPSASDWVATVQVSNVPEWEANARLIAAAPDLLAALDGIVVLAEFGWLHCHPGVRDENLARVRAARAAIAKATGRG